MRTQKNGRQALGGQGEKQIVIYADADYAGEAETRRSTSDVLGQVGGDAVVRASRVQQVVALSTTEAESIAAVESTKEGLWLKKVKRDQEIRSGPVEALTDNQGALALLHDPTVNRRTKHSEARMGFQRDVKEKKLDECRTEKQLADPLTKGLAAERVRTWRAAIGIE